jgi:flagellin-like hook-associated protein FlgL
VTQGQRDAAAEEVHGLLQELTRIGNDQVGGRRLFAALQQDSGTAPFDSPDQVGYDPTAAYHGPATGFSISVGAGATDVVRLSTPGDQVFGSSLVALADLEDRLRTGGDVNGAIDPLEAARQTVAAERASVGARENLLFDRLDQVKAQVLQQKTTRSRLADTDLTEAITRLTQLQTALQAALAAGSQIAQTSLTALLRL